MWDKNRVDNYLVRAGYTKIHTCMWTLDKPTAFMSAAIRAVAFKGILVNLV